MTQGIRAIAHTPTNTPSSQLMLQLSNLNVYYGESHILRNVDLTVSAGQMVGLIGRKRLPTIKDE
jgi:urea transport system ATP-binding protein